MAFAADWPKLSQKCTFILHFGKRFGKQNRSYFRLPEIAKRADIWLYGSRAVVILCIHKKREKPNAFSRISL